MAGILGDVQAAPNAVLHNVFALAGAQKSDIQQYLATLAPKRVHRLY